MEDEKTKSVSTKTKAIMIFLLCIICVGINIGGSKLAGLLNMPVFLDSAGTILAATVGGYVPGILVGYITNILNNFADSTSIYYGVLSVLIAVAATLRSRHGTFRSLPRALLAIPGHLGFSVIFGYFYGRARHEANGGRDGLARTNLLIGYLLSVAAHAFYDACAMIGTSTSMGIFYVFVAVMYLFLYRLIKRESATNDYI